MNNYFVDLVLFSLDGSAINGIDSIESSSALSFSSEVRIRANSNSLVASSAELSVAG